MSPLKRASDQEEEIRMRSGWKGWAAAAAVGILAACGSSGGSPGTGSTQTVTLTLMVGGLNKQIYLPNMLTQRLGYFQEQNLNVTLIDEGSGQGTEDEVIAGNDPAGSGYYAHTCELNSLGQKLEAILQFLN